MIPGPDKVIECPDCGALSKVFTLISGNTFGARNWSDGKSDAPMLPKPPPITRCANGSHFYWIATAKVVGEIETIGGPGPNVDATWIEAPQVTELSFKEYLEAVDLGLAKSDEEEKLLRILAWWRENDAYRDTAEDALFDPSDRSPESEANLRRLLLLFQDSSWRGEIVKSEIYRQLGEFDMAASLLEDLPAEAPAEIVSRLLNLARDENPNLVEFTNA